jgi:hypothetical protein
MQITNTIDLTAQTLDVSSQPELGVTTKECAECGSPFESKGEHHLYCCGACRQRAYRRSPAHRAVLDGKKQQRRNRRLYQHQEKYRACSIGFDSRFGGPINESVPSVGDLDLKRFSKIKE